MNRLIAVLILCFSVGIVSASGTLGGFNYQGSECDGPDGPEGPILEHGGGAGGGGRDGPKFCPDDSMPPCN